MNSLETSLKKTDILVVDDTPANLRLLSNMMTEYGYNVRQAISGKMALTAVKAVKPDLILLDINMPEMNGYQVCEQLKSNEETRRIPIIFLSALDDALDKVKAFQVGGVDYVTKPFQFEEIIVRIQNQLTIQSLQNQLQHQNNQLKTTLSELQVTQARLVQQEKMVGLMQLVAGIAHEINNPISFISGNLDPANEYIQDLLKLIQLYRNEYPQPPQVIQKMTEEIDLDFIISDLPKIIGSMKNGVHRISTIILALRIFSHLDESDIKSVNLHEGIDSTIILLQHRFKLPNGDCVLKIIKNYGKIPKITCYPSQLNQVFLNLLSNAIDAIESKLDKNPETFKNPRIWIATRLKDKETVQIIIKDNGMGILPEVKSRLFDPFFTTKPVGKGSGLGLLTSYQIVVEKHRGKLDFYSAFGEGAEFIVEIPVQQAKITS
ncbi:hybrid sensor histidine kinase/response regulator [Limnoraphis robusta]|uniref:histidine kinase n=1 Tax=Limnoraphis robusta CCNP1315 TaxID=3110306 RepID=A0ABU5UB30_9CYAN|nr:response regulator [Limnoraphis robusta]MEA5523333.1 response regulator [Limnoraphis robusta CCNP1315]MEA5545905.1 response regulator [Limnoraphis robusta CCNP1324]